MQIIWDDEPGGNLEHLAEHGITPEEFEEILRDDRIKTGVSRKTKRPMKQGWTSTGKYIVIVWDEYDEDPRVIYPVTAFTPDE